MGLLDQKDRIKKDIYIAIDVWGELLEELGETIEYSYVKGSALNDWYSEIDYVPHISDLDIFIKLYGEKSNLLPQFEPDSFGISFNINEKYEKLFKEKCLNQTHTFFHIPRIHLITLNLTKDIPPREQDVTVLKGDLEFQSEVPHDLVKDIDLKNILDEEKFLYSLPELLINKSTYEYFVIFYKIASKVSSFPIRMLTQFTRENPHDVWNWTRTRIAQELEKLGFSNIADHYRRYYFTGWELFEANFQNTDLFRRLIRYGFSILLQCYNEMTKLNRV